MINKIKNMGFVTLLSVMAVFYVSNSSAKSLEAEFIGNEAFRISDGTDILFTDFPYVSGAYDSMTYVFDFPGTVGKGLSLISHRHEDHFAPLQFIEQKWTIIGPNEVTVQLPQNKVIKLENVIHTGPMKIYPKKTSHSNTEHYSYLVEWNNKKLFFSGDTEDTDVLKDLPELDALFITPWFYRKAMLNKRLPKTRKIIIYHHKMKEIVPGCKGCIIPDQYQVIDID